MDSQGWSLLAGQHNMGPQIELLSARDCRLSYRIDDSASLAFVMDGDDPAWDYITELETDIWLYRNNQVFYRGRVGPTTDNIDEDSYNISVNTFDYREWLKRQILGVGSKITWDQKTRAVIIQDILNYVNGRPGIKPTITLDSTRLGTTLTDFDLLVGTMAGDALAAMTGFGWQVVPTSVSGIAVKAVSPFYYVLNDYFVAEYGGTISKVTRQLDTGSFANRALVTGDMALAPQERNSATIATDIRGPFGVVVSDPSIIKSTALVSRANEEIAARDTLAADWKVDFVPGAWVNESDAWLGDIVRFVVKRGRININDMYRITEFDLSLSDDGKDQTVSATLVKPPYVPVALDTPVTLEEHRNVPQP